MPSQRRPAAGLRQPSPKRTSSAAALPAVVAGSGVSRALALSCPRQLPRALGSAQPEALPAAAHRPQPQRLQQPEAVAAGGSAGGQQARKRPALRPTTTLPTTTQEAASAPAATAATAPGPAQDVGQVPTHIAQTGTAAAGGPGGVGSARHMEGGIALRSCADGGDQGASGSGASEASDREGVAGDKSNSSTSSSSHGREQGREHPTQPMQQPVPGMQETAGEPRAADASPPPAAMGRNQRGGDAPAPIACGDVVSTTTPAPPPAPSITAAGSGPSTADACAHANEAAVAVEVCATAAQAPALSPSPAPALLRAARSPLQRERASAPAPTAPADPSPLPQRTSPCVSASRSGAVPSASATTEQEQRRLAEQLASLVVPPMLALDDEVAQPQWSRTPPPPPPQGQQPEELQSATDAGDAALVAEPGAGLAARGAATAALSAARGAVSQQEEMTISRLPMKEPLLQQPRPLDSAFASAPFSQLMGALPVSRLLAPLPPSTPPQLRVASAAAARAVQGSLRPRKASAPAAHLVAPHDRLSCAAPAQQRDASDPAGWAEGSAAVRQLLTSGRGLISGGGDGGGGAAAGSAAAAGRGQHLCQSVRLARLLATARGNTLRAFRPAAPLPRPIRMATAESSVDGLSDGLIGDDQDGAASEPSPEAPAPCEAACSPVADASAAAGGDAASGTQRKPAWEPMASELQEEQDAQAPVMSAAAPLTHCNHQSARDVARGRGIVAQTGTSTAERAESEHHHCWSAVVARDGAVEMESRAESPPSGEGGVVDRGRRRLPGVAARDVAGCDGADAGATCGEQRTAWSGLSLAFLADVFGA
ncbi:hypothetical protein HYH02_008486 [Chlamydomonas schloesseri]|uniref:Uncharacterized protein n=1 Tax=Chlamydomonas schloesseri TaxID=2026947 RepID=A0A836B3D5_9CHLO|nr:hypothetical protein HYH02_008486 [Chlamydomonas schloesseri]|eukprot:KAG2446495.1 hypothetical protein HYH02_008486 [Chlamydomonas schloesseri]